jgi:hypothetical protein
LIYKQLLDDEPTGFSTRPVIHIIHKAMLFDIILELRGLSERKGKFTARRVGRPASSNVSLGENPASVTPLASECRQFHASPKSLDLT